MYIYENKRNIKLRHDQEYTHSAVVYFKDDQIVKIEKVDDWFPSTKLVDAVIRKIYENKYDFATTTFFNNSTRTHFASKREDLLK